VNGFRFVCLQQKTNAVGGGGGRQSQCRRIHSYGLEEEKVVVVAVTEGLTAKAENVLLEHTRCVMHALRRSLDAKLSPVAPLSARLSIHESWLLAHCVQRVARRSVFQFAAEDEHGLAHGHADVVFPGESFSVRVHATRKCRATGQGAER
jgi:hypothetical protein